MPLAGIAATSAPLGLRCPHDGATHLSFVSPPAGVCQPLSLEMDEESDDELEALAGLYRTDSSADLAAAAAGGGGGVPGQLHAHRFALLRDLWARAS